MNDRLLTELNRDAHFDTQSSFNDMTAALREQIKWCTSGLEPNPLTRINPLRPFVQWYNTRRMDRYIYKELETRYSVRQGGSWGKSIVDLALKAYVNENLMGKISKGMDSTFKELAVNQVKLFIFAGHDTTASTMCYLYLLLSRNPAALVQVRAEHDVVFGPHLAEADSLITSKPHLLNRLPYTLAVIKETLRLFPAATVPRVGQRDFLLTNSEGRQYSTEGCMVVGIHHALHRNPRWWPHPDEFLPERWLVEPDHPLYPVQNAWRPFERGLRMCIGQELAIIEMKIVMALTMREFDVHSAYVEYDQLNRKGENYVNSVDGERAYQIKLGSAHPSDGLPCKVVLAKINSYSSETTSNGGTENC